jgi:hypothetical protein
MQQILIPIGIMVGLSILSWLVQQMKNAADKKQMQRDRERQRAAAAARAERMADNRDREFDRPVPPPPPPAMRAANSEVDRFMQEINRLRERAGAPPAGKAGTGGAAKPIPTVQPVRKKKRISEEAPSTFPATTGQVATGQSLVTSPPPPARDELPMAAIVGTAPRIVSVPPAPGPTSPPVVTKAVKTKSVMVDRPDTPATGAGVQLLALLKDKKSLAAAVLLHEVLGPPKAKRSIG